MRFQADLGSKDGSMLANLKRELVSPLLERVAPATGLPHVEIDWTDEEARNLSALISAEPAAPASPIRRSR
jgi:hypothetical protein